MSDQFPEAQESVQKAREALRRGDRTRALQWAEHAARLAPQMEDPWLILAAVASPRAGVEYIQHALKINPRSPRARQGMEWAMQRLREMPQEQSRVGNRETAARPAPLGRKRSSKRGPLYPVLLFGLGCLVVGFTAWSASTAPAVASILNSVAPTLTPPQSWARAEIAKPTYTPSPEPTFAPTLLATPSPLPTEAPTLTAAEDFLPTLTPEPAWNGSLTIEYVADTPTVPAPTYAPAPTSESRLPAAGKGYGRRWIDVNLSQQMVYAYEGDAVVNSFLVSTGTWLTPTVTGQYRIYVKLLYTDMAGDGYYLPEVPYTMYFYKGYGLHGTYWHHNFGTPMSHGCVNMSIPDAAWLYSWASVGTLVNVHY